jgi:chromosome segregation ATPase
MLETIRETVQDLIAPELKTHGVRLENLERRLDDARHSLEQRSDDLKSGLEHRIEDAKEVLRAEIRTLEARFATLESLIRNLTQQVTFESGLRERMASLEARLPKQ